MDDELEKTKAILRHEYMRQIALTLRGRGMDPSRMRAMAADIAEEVGEQVLERVGSADAEQIARRVRFEVGARPAIIDDDTSA